MRFAKVVFLIAGVWGMLIMSPMYFMFDAVGRAYPPPITHPDIYYGFVGVTLAWQVAFLVIARDPVRLRPMMIPAILEKLGYMATVGVLFVQGRVESGQFLVVSPDLVLGVLFVAAYLKTPGSSMAPGTTALHA